MYILRHYIALLLTDFFLTGMLILSFSSCKKESEKIMSVSNDSLSEISYTSAKAYATIIDKGEGIEQYGHCWSTNASLTEVDNKGKTQLGSANLTGPFTSNLTNLTPGTRYYVRSYLKNSNNTVYGDDILDFYTLSMGLPVVNTGSASSITATGATIGGDIESLGLGASSVSQHGHCWSDETTTPTLSDQFTSQGTKNTTGTFESVIVGLSQGKLYYVRAYATNSMGTAYGDTISFVTLAQAGVPAVTTGTVYNITETSATASGSIDDLGSGASSVTQYGHCWSNVTSTPTISDNVTTLGSRSTTGDFESSLSDLSANVTYYVRAYASNSMGTAYGDVTSFATLSEPGVPVVTTGTIYNITEISATAAGSIDDLGSGASSVMQYGHCWSNVTTTPTISDNLTTHGSRSTTGNFESSLTGLSANVTYYVRAYATNDAGTGYGSSVPFSTATTAGMPQLTTSEVTSITGTTAISGGTIAADGGSAITAKGICWSTSSGPTTANDHTYEGSGSGAFESEMTGLVQNWKYYVRAYATNASGTGYGNELVFTTIFDCGTRYTDPRDGKSYLTVLIGHQCWMSENLNVGERLEGNNDATDNGIIEKYCYDDEESNCDVYGGLYQWNEMMGYTTTEMAQGVCPKGWHIPSDYEWKTLEMELGMTQEQADAAGWRGTDEGGKLKAAGYTFWEQPNTGATNSSLFTALPAGGRDNVGTFCCMGTWTDYWTSTTIVTQSIYRMLSSTESRIERIDGNRSYSTAVRCLKDD
jgi:uncharacterized protein (TIGR02145 family)